MHDTVYFSQSAFPSTEPERKSHLTTESLDGSNERLWNTFLYLLLSLILHKAFVQITQHVIKLCLYWTSLISFTSRPVVSWNC